MIEISITALSMLVCAGMGLLALTEAREEARLRRLAAATSWCLLVLLALVGFLAGFTAIVLAALGGGSLMQTRPISFSVDGRVYANLEKRAAPMGLRPAEYARRLFEAAYLARVAGERGEAFDDAALDRQVRLTFLLADCEPDFIAEAIGMPRERARAIVEGWRTVAGEIAAQPLLALPAPTGLAEAPGTMEPPAVPADQAGAAAPSRKRDPRSVKAWPDEMVATMRAMWAEGRTMKEIGAAVGKTAENVSVFASKNRDMFPRRAT